MFNYLRPCRHIACLAALLACSANTAKADLVVDIQSTDLEVGGTGTIDVLISSTTNLDPLKAFDFDFRITPLGVPTSFVRFTNPQNDSQLTDTDYVFFNDSDAFIDDSAVGTVSSFALPQDQYVGGDLTDSGNAVILTSSSVLVTLDVFHSVPGDPETQVGKTFSVSLAGANFLDDLNAGIAFTSNSGTVSLISAVPEPSALSLFALMGIPFIGNRRCRKRNHK